jgi:putative tryptophan/tyrosine transport system substrate-binding protein
MVIGIGRRQFTAALGSTAVAWSIAARAQQPAMPVIGFMNVESPQGYARPLAAFLKGLGEAGYTEGQNVAIEYRWAEGQTDRLPAMAADLVHRQVAVIAATTLGAALAAKAATTTIPIVFETAAVPVKLGLVASLNRPGGNVTGVTQLTVGLVPKELELLHEVLPTARVMALLVNPRDASAETELREMMAAAQSLGLELHVLNASTEHDFDAVFTKLIELRAGALVIGTFAFFTSHAQQLGALAARHSVPAVYKGREFAAAGGLMSYGSDVTDSYHLAGNFTGRILKGEKPSDLPVQQATKIELIINLKTAKSLGITFPLTLLGRADEVIE